MKNKIQELIRQGNEEELQKIMVTEQVELSKADIDKLIGFAEYTNQSNIIDILQKAAKNLIKDEWTQCGSLNTTGDTDKEDNESIKTKTLLEDFSKIKLMLNSDQEIKPFLNNKELLAKHDEYNDILMHLACSLYIEEQNKTNIQFLYSLKDAYQTFSLNPNVENNFGVTPAEILGEVDYSLAEELFA